MKEIKQLLELIPFMFMLFTMVLSIYQLAKYYQAITINEILEEKLKKIKL